MVLPKGEVVPAEAGLEHVEVGVEHARIDAVDGQRPLEAADGRRHAPQRIARDVRFDALGDEVVDQPADQVLDPEGQPQRVELGLVVVAVDRGDAGGDVPLLIDVLDGDRHGRVEDDRLEPLENGERRVEQAVARGGRGTRLPRGQRPLEVAARPRLETQVAADRLAYVIGRQGVLVGEQLVGARHEGDAAAAGRAGRRRVTLIPTVTVAPLLGPPPQASHRAPPE